MAAGNTVVARFAGEDSGFTRVANQVADTGEKSARRMGDAFDKAGNAADASESKFMGMADVLDGLGGAFGVPTEGATNMMRSFGDLSGGFAVLQPAIASVGGSFKAFGATLMANPIFLIIGAVAGLAAGLVWAYHNVEWFRDGVNAAFEAVSNVASSVFNFLVSVGGWAFDRLRGPVEAYVGFYSAVFGTIIDVTKSVFNAVARLWNAGPGKIGFTVPDWVPLVGGNRFDIPDIPMLAAGGIVKARPGGTLLVAGEGGQDEAVVPLSRAGGLGGATVIVQVQGSVIEERNLGRTVARALEPFFGDGGRLTDGRGGSMAPA